MEQNAKPSPFPPPHPTLSAIVCVTLDRFGRELDRFQVNQNEHEGRKRTATAARRAMIAGQCFVTFPAYQANNFARHGHRAVADASKA